MTAKIRIDFQNNRFMSVRLRWGILLFSVVFQVMDVVATAKTVQPHVVLLGESNTWMGGDD